MKESYLFNTNKIKYVKGKKPDVQCILCAINDGSGQVEDLTVHKSELVTVALNLYPFNPGHLMVFPNRHIISLQELTTDESAHIHYLTVKSLDILGKSFEPSGYNIGYNIGHGSGGSIAHIHQHIVPRYENEVGYLDVLAGARVIVSDPKAVHEELKLKFSKIDEFEGE